LRDPVTLLQARTTLCLVHLKNERASDAQRAIDQARHYRRQGRSLVVLALLGLTARQNNDRTLSRQRFDRLYAEASARIDNDSKDFGAWHFKGFAACGKHLETGAGLDEAIVTFRDMPAPTRPAPVLVGRLRFMLGQLAGTGGPPDSLAPAVDELDR
jgi:hypothetical protein